MNSTDRGKSCLPLLDEVPMLKALGDEERRFIAGGCRQRTAAKGLVVCEKGSRLDGFYCIVEGRIKLAVLSEEGAERVVTIAFPGQTFGEPSAFLDTPFPMYAEALCESRLLHFDRERLREAMARWPKVGLAILQAVARRADDLTRDLEACCLHSATRRVTSFLLREAQRCEQPDQAAVVLPAAKVIVASSLNLTAETFSRELRDLARRGLIDIDRRTIRIRSMGRLGQQVLAA